jgi:hypothetical protein
VSLPVLGTAHFGAIAERQLVLPQCLLLRSLHCRIISSNKWNQILACFKTPYISNYLATDIEGWLGHRIAGAAEFYTASDLFPTAQEKMADILADIETSLGRPLKISDSKLIPS